MSDVYRENYELKRDLERSRIKISALENEARTIRATLETATPRYQKRVMEVGKIIDFFFPIADKRDKQAAEASILQFLSHQVYEYEHICRYFFRSCVDAKDVVREAKRDIIAEVARRLLPWIKADDRRLEALCVLDEALREHTGHTSGVTP